jgi:hypothetical protein
MFIGHVLTGILISSSINQTLYCLTIAICIQEHDVYAQHVGVARYVRIYSRLA